MAAIAQTIAIVDKSGKVVSTSKQLKNVFKEARSAYMEKKAEITAERKARDDRELRKAIKAMSLAEDQRSERSRSLGQRPAQGRRESELRQRRPSGARHHSSGSVGSGSVKSDILRSPHHEDSPRSPSLRRASTYAPGLEQPRSAPRSHLGPERTSNDLIRRHTDLDLAPAHRSRPRSLHRTNSTGGIDLDLAYGDFHPEDLSAGLAPRGPQQEKEELSSLVAKCKMLLDEAKCAEHSVKAIVAHLQKNPDAMAAVALTLAEISNIASKMAPGALVALRSGAPAVFALLAAPEFLIAVGVSVGITVVMFGGYKIIKKIRARSAADKEVGMDEMIDVDDLSSIEHWRRGIADVDADTRSEVSGATSVEGEFITPIAAASMGHLPSSRRTKKENGDKKDKDKGKTRKAPSERSSSSSSKASRSGSLSTGDRNSRALIKVKKPSPLRRVFGREDRSSVAS